MPDGGSEPVGAVLPGWGEPPGEVDGVPDFVLVLVLEGVRVDVGEPDGVDECVALRVGVGECVGRCDGVGVVVLRWWVTVLLVGLGGGAGRTQR